MQSKNQFTSEIRLSFDHHKVMFIHSLNAVFNSLTLKKNEHRDIKCSFENISFYELLFEQSSKDYLNVTRSYKEIYFLSKIIKLSKKLLKSELL